MVHVGLIGPYVKYIRQQQTGGDTTTSNLMIDPTTGWFEIFEIPTYDIDEVTGGNDEYIYK